MLMKCCFSVKKSIFSGMTNPLSNKGEPWSKIFAKSWSHEKNVVNFLCSQQLSGSALRQKGTPPWIISFRYLFRISDSLFLTWFPCSTILFVSIFFITLQSFFHEIVVGREAYIYENLCLRYNHRSNWWKVINANCTVWGSYLREICTKTKAAGWSVYFDGVDECYML